MSTPVQKGRLDSAILAFGEVISETVRQKTGYDFGGDVRELAEQFIEHWGIPREPINIPLMLARQAGLLPKQNTPRKLRRAS